MATHFMCIAFIPTTSILKSTDTLRFFFDRSSILLSLTYKSKEGVLDMIELVNDYHQLVLSTQIFKVEVFE